MMYETAPETLVRIPGRRAPKPQDGGDNIMFKHILLPTDGSPLSEKGVKRGIAFAKGVKARVTTMHVVPQFRLLADADPLPSAVALRQRLVAEAQERAKRIVDRPAKWAKTA